MALRQVPAASLRQTRVTAAGRERAARERVTDSHDGEVTVSHIRACGDIFTSFCLIPEDLRHDFCEQCEHVFTKEKGADD